MTDDIIERLRMPTAYGDDQRKEAADEIERLRAVTPDRFYEIEAWGNHWYMRALKADDTLHRLQGCDIDNAAQDIIIAALEHKFMTEPLRGTTAVFEQMWRSSEQECAELRAEIERLQTKNDEEGQKLLDEISKPLRDEVERLRQDNAEMRELLNTLAEGRALEPKP